MTNTPQFGKRESTSEAASAAMRGNRARDTTPELLLRRALWRRGHRYRLHDDTLPGRPDLVFRRERVVVFCDGDFWHGRNWSERRVRLKAGSNADYWVPKIRANMDRDARHTLELQRRGWWVIRLWEGDIKRDPEQAADRVTAVLRASGDAPLVRE